MDLCTVCVQIELANHSNALSVYINVYISNLIALFVSPTYPKITPLEIRNVSMKYSNSYKMTLANNNVS